MPTDPTVPTAPDAVPATPAASAPHAARAARVDVQPVLEQLAQLHPSLFGAEFRPLKRGIFEDLLAAHPELLQPAALKAALAQHTRSTRYLTAVAAGQPRTDLQGQAVEPMAPEHVHHALLEVFRRRQARSREDLGPKLRRRLVQAIEASGLTREAYRARMPARDAAAQALLDAALAEVARRAARGEALLRAYEASGSTLAEFAEMYGLDAREASGLLELARRAKAALPA